MLFCIVVDGKVTMTFVLVTYIQQFLKGDGQKEEAYCSKLLDSL
jgi:hypothetical protein